MGYKESVRWVRTIAILDMVLSIFPIAFYSVASYFFGFLIMVGSFRTGYGFFDWIMTATMTVQDTQVDVDNPGQVADMRMFRCSVWGIAVLFNLLDLTMAFLLLHAIRRSKTEQPFLGWLVIRGFVIFTMFILIIALLSTGSSFLSQLLSLFYLIYRCVSFWIVYKHVQNIRDEGGVP